MVDVRVLSDNAPDKSPIDATPKARDIFHGYTRGGYTIAAAVAEYVDNAIEQARISGRGKDATVQVTVSSFGPKIATEIEDDAGGCPRAQAVRFVQPGLSGVSPDGSAISRFGMGGKAAGLSIAEKVIILSRSKGEPGWRVVLDRAEILLKTDWKFEVTGLPEGVQVKEGSTRVILVLLERPSPALYPARYVAELSERYAFLPKETRPKILVGTTPLTTRNPLDDLLTADEAPNGCGPRAFAMTKSYPMNIDGNRRLADVRFRMTVGLLPEGTAGGQYGAHIYCNGRLLFPNSKIGLIEDGFDLREKSPSTVGVWLRAIIQVDGPSEVMPWTNRKDSVDSSSPSYNDLSAFAKSGYDSFMMENLGDARREVKEETGELPDIRNLLSWSYREKIRKGTLKARTLRSLVVSSYAYQKALEAEPEEELPEPPKKTDEVTLHASIEKWKVDRMRKLIRRKLGEETVHNTDIVRVSVNHYLECVGGTAPDPDVDEMGIHKSKGS
jgi:hypothetical protein